MTSASELLVASLLILQLVHAQDQVSFGSYNYPESHLGFDENGLAFMQSQARRFYMRPGLTGEEGTISLESVDYPNCYFRHYDYLVDLENASNARNPDIFKNDATFRRLDNQWFDNTITFEATNMRHHLLRHSSSRVQMDLPDGTTIFEQDSAWIPKYYPQPGPDVGAILGLVFGLLSAVVLIIIIVVLVRWNAQKAGKTSLDYIQTGFDNPAYQRFVGVVRKPVDVISAKVSARRSAESDVNQNKSISFTKDRSGVITVHDEHSGEDQSTA